MGEGLNKKGSIVLMSSWIRDILLMTIYQLNSKYCSICYCNLRTKNSKEERKIENLDREISNVIGVRNFIDQSFFLGIFCGLAGLKDIWNIQQALWDMDE